MSQLIITVMAIALTALTLVSSINYIPWWYKSAADTEHVLREGLETLERGFKAAARNNAGIPLGTTAEADGGFASNFTPLLRLLPRAPSTFEWSYHQKGMDGTDWQGLNYFCLTSPTEGNIGDWKGLKRGGLVYSDMQYVVGPTCGATENMAEPASFPATFAATFYVAFVPGVDD